MDVLYFLISNGKKGFDCFAYALSAAQACAVQAPRYEHLFLLPSLWCSEIENNTIPSPMPR